MSAPDGEALSDPSAPEPAAAAPPAAPTGEDTLAAVHDKADGPATSTPTEGQARRRVPKRPPPVEDKPIIAGRLWWAIAMLAGLGLIANPKFNGELDRRLARWRRDQTPAPWVRGQTATVTVTLITADYVRLACQHREKVAGAQCDYQTDRLRAFPDASKPLDDNGVDRIQPYRTSNSNQLILIAGLWATPEVAYRLHQEPPYGVPEKKLVRFDAECRVRFVAQLPTVQLRWEASAPWQTERQAWVARAESCKVPLVERP